LRQKGVSADVIEAALADLDAEDAAYRAAESRTRRMRGAQRSDFQTKIIAHLQRRGFSYEVARLTIRRLLQELDAEDPEYFAGDEDANDMMEE
jgi:SOS response regulatory protein OraA/RecX